MNEYPKIFKSKYGKVSIYKASPSGFKIIWRRGKTLFEERRADENRAIERAEEIFGQLELGEQIMSRIDQEKISYYVTCEQLLDGKISLMDVVRDWVKRQPKVTAVDLRDAIEKYLETMAKRGLSKEHMAPVRSRLNQFAEAMPANISEITVQEVAKYLETYENLRSRLNHRAALHKFFNWCQAQGMVTKGEPHAVTQTEVPKIKWVEPEIIPPEDLAKVLWVAKKVYPEIVVPIALGAFGGLRRAEIERLKCSEIDMEQGIITLSAAITKTNMRRVVTINATLRSWIQEYLIRGQDFSDSSYVFKVRRCVEYVKACWPVNGLRHSFISYQVQREKNTAAVALEAGHSVSTLMKHYKCLCTPDNAEAWFAITPDTTNFGNQDREGVEKA